MDPRALSEVFWKLHGGLPQQGPGSDRSTERALRMISDLPAAPRILDLGCGPGRQTLALARLTGGTVTAVDLIPAFLEQLRSAAEAAGLADRIETLQQSMGDLSFEDASYDLLWSEGAIYNVGFAAGLRAWRRLLRPGGSAAVTEATWLTDSPPERVRDFWESIYPAMQSIEANERAIADAGYEPIGSFVLPEREWWDGYYALIEPRIEKMRGEVTDEAGVAALDDAQVELDVFRASEGSYGYVFYVMRSA